MKLKNKTVLVTASTRGIGLAIVKKCAKEGATVYMAARNPERAEKLAEELPGIQVELEKVSFSDESRLYNNLCDAIEGKAEQFVTHDQQRRLIRVVEAMFESAEKNEVIKF